MPKTIKKVEPFNEEETKEMPARAQMLAYKINEVIETVNNLVEGKMNRAGWKEETKKP